MTTLQEVINKFKEYLYLKDTKMLETILAAILSNQIKGTPIWIIFCGASGDAKSTQLLSILQIDKVLMLDQLTKNTLASGKPNVVDVGNYLQESSHIILIPDLACISAKYKDDRKEIFASMRNLYDGFIRKHTGSGKFIEYNNCHVSLIAGATHTLKKEYLIHQQLGSRELIFDTDAMPQDNQSKMEKAWQNESYEREMKADLQKVVKDFIKNVELKDVEISDDIQRFLMKQANRLSILRSVADYNQFSDELDNPVYPEVPTRLIKQFKRLWKCLKSLDDNYSDERCKEIIEHIVKSSGDTNRQFILNQMIMNPNTAYSVNEMKYIAKIGYRATKRELEVLWNIGLVDKEIIEIKGTKAYDKVSYTLNKDRCRFMLGEPIQI